jgi:hypothetical protein
MECQFCNKVLQTKYSLISHQTKTKYCLKLQGKEKKGSFVCNGCNKDFYQKIHLDNHEKICDYCSPVSKLLLKRIELLTNTIKELREDKNNLQERYDNLSLTAVKRNFEDETTIEIDVNDSDSESESDNEEYKLTPLELGNGYTIEHREDGFINVTNLCKAGKKQFNHWKSIEKTKGFLRVLSSSTEISVDELIKYNTGGNSERATWAHPQVAINIAQWISPSFDVKVSSWVYEVMITGKVDITNTKSYKELQKENKNKDIKIQFLTKKYVKSQPRVQYEEKNVIYILTTKLMKKERRYILGKAVDLTSRLSTYNKSDEHEVIFFGSCKDVETMNVVENMVFTCLNEYREQANRERFVLPKNENVELFSNAIKKSIEFFK